MRTTTRLGFLAMLALSVACTVKDTTAPPLAGPSELSLRLGLQVVPDSILQDGASQAVLSIDASTADGRAARGLALRVEIIVNGVIQDYGMLSSKTVVTGEDGRARVVYTAPARPTTQVDDVNVITLRVTPIGNDFGGETPRVVSLRLVTPGVIVPPNDAPVAAFTYSPTTVTVLGETVFDASTSTDSGIACGASCRYEWDFGDGRSDSGVFVSHVFRREGLHMVKLTVTDAGGASASTTKAVTVGLGAAPTAVFTFSPTAPAVSQDIFFNAGASTAAPGRRIVAWDWDFGSGRFGSGVTITKRYDTAGTYNVTLTVTDDSGAQAISTPQSVEVGGAGTGAQAALTVSPTAGTTNTVFFFDGRTSSGPSSIVNYTFTFGDATPEQDGPNGTATHQFSTPGSYVVRLTVRDSMNRTATTTLNLTVSAP